MSSNESVLKATGRSWAEWYALLDGAGARELDHGAIASKVHELGDVTGWWGQQIAVSYERARGLRAVNERPDGYSVPASLKVRDALKTRGAPGSSTP